ncbi:uncharacterized protein LOC131170243 [Hevea brasiliensis]|uniref:uncharacterized protein LOC131170243 n=1 Tax=Hevea brasiliensis TaxID=3981 RepID=UPI0025F0AE43|nr:uncharacterized protein LOC131170243 [Hevea brasiliensis]
MHFDGAVNLTGNEIGVVLVSPDGRHFPIAIKLRFGYTANVAEYEAYVSGLQAVIEMKIKKLEVYGYLALIIHQVKGEWQTKDPKLIPYQKYLHELIKEFEEISFTHLSQDKNNFADVLATLVVMTQMEEGQITEYPPGASKNERRMVRRLAMGYFPSGEVLYKRSSNGELLRKAVKGSVIADLLAENPINDYEALDFEFPYEYINTVSNDAECLNDV